jgi:hypothetical protein
MDPVAQAPSAGGERHAEGVDGSGLIAGLFQKLAGARLGRIFPALDQARRQFPGEGFERRPVLPNNRNAAIRCPRNNGEIVELANGVVDLRRFAGCEFHFTRDHVHPWRDFGGAARSDFRPFFNHGMRSA